MCSPNGLRENSRVDGLETVKVRGLRKPAAGALRGNFRIRKIWPADCGALALGFAGPDPDTMVAQLNLAMDDRGNYPHRPATT
jgi:NADPH-dependent glutamate synthase beta subunit-like oxidoreductase